MTEEERNVEEKTYERRNECNCQVFSKFLMLTSAVFLGSLLAILVAKALTTPAFPPCPCAMKNLNRAVYERQIPPMIDGKPIPRHEFRNDHNKFDKRKFEEGKKD